MLIMCYIGGELYTGVIRRIFVANSVIIGVSIASIIIAMLVIMCKIIEFRRRTILLRNIRRQDQSNIECQDMFLKPPPYDFCLSAAPSYAENPPLHTQNSTGGVIQNLGN